FTRQLLSPKPGERWHLVTSAFHMPRSMGIFRRAGFDVEAYPVDWRMGGRDDLFTFTRIGGDGLARTEVAVREWIGLLAYRIMGRTGELLPGPGKDKKRIRKDQNEDCKTRTQHRRATAGREDAMQQQNADSIDLAGLVADLNSLLRLNTTVIGMKL